LLVKLTTKSLDGSVLRVIVMAVAAAPAFSATDVATTFTLSAGLSLSVTSRASLPLANPLAEAVIVTVWVPSATASSNTSKLTTAEVWPAGIVIVGGTIPSVASLLMRLTTNALVVSVLRVMVTAVAAGPAFSRTEGAVTFTVNAGLSLSVTVIVSLPLAKPFAVAVSVTVWVPSTRRSSRTSRLTVTDA
jgi:hypothetical protein